MTGSATVSIREVGLRDGLQNVVDFMPTSAKCAWIDAEVAAGVREIEVCSFVPPKLIPQFSDAEEVVAHALGLSGLTPVALIPNLKGAERGIALGVPKMVFVLSVSESHNQANVRRSTSESVADFGRIVALRDGGSVETRFALTAALATSFGCTYEGRVDEGRVVELARTLAGRGADEIMLGDTVGFADPAHVRRLVRPVQDAVAPVPVACHFHDTRGLGLANAFAAYEEGVREFDASLGGLGGCPYAPKATGNVVCEDLAFMFEAMGVATGIDLDALVRVRDIVAAALPDAPLYGSLSRAGLPTGFAKAG
jgi:hydroxymethylglutaryl-CoA lyase